MRGVGCGVLLAAIVVGAAGYRQKDSMYGKDALYNKDTPYSKDPLFNSFAIDIKRYDLLGGAADVTVPCPVCPGDECQKIDGQDLKVCRYGTHTNYGCHARIDCFRGPGEICSEDRSWQCERTLSCRDNQCRGFSLFGAFEHPNYAGKDH